MATPSTNMTYAAMGIAFLYQGSLHVDLNVASVSFGVPYYSISLSLNVILTLMIVGRLILHSRKFQSAIGTTAKTGGLYKAIVTMLIESCALYAITYLLFMAPWAAGSSVGNAFFPILAEVQVRTLLHLPDPPHFGYPRLIVVTNRSSLRTSLFFGLPTERHSRAMPSSPGRLLRFASRAKGDQWAVMGPIPTTVL